MDLKIPDEFTQCLWLFLQAEKAIDAHSFARIINAQNQPTSARVCHRDGGFCRRRHIANPLKIEFLGLWQNQSAANTVILYVSITHKT